MNILIRKFWEDIGTVYRSSALESYEVHIGPGPIRLIEIVAHGDLYRFNKKWYSEEEMLKIIKMKAFYLIY